MGLDVKNMAGEVNDFHLIIFELVLAAILSVATDATFFNLC